MDDRLCHGDDRILKRHGVEKAAGGQCPVQLLGGDEVDLPSSAAQRDRADVIPADQVVQGATRQPEHLGDLLDAIGETLGWGLAGRYKVALKSILIDLGSGFVV